MGLFCKKFSVCRECSVHFEPTTGEGSDLCSTHRTPYLQLLARKRLVMSWAERNWEKLEEQAEKARQEDIIANNKLLQAEYSAMAAQQAAQQAAYHGPIRGLGNIFGL